MTHPQVRSLSEHPDRDVALELHAWVDATSFGEPPDATRLDAKRPLIDPDLWYLAELDGEPCGSSGAFPFELTTPGGAQVPVSGVGDVGVLPTHRRRGVLSAMLRRLFADAADRGDVAAVLHASEAAIYRRFGFGVGTRWRYVELEARRAAFRPDRPDPGGRVRAVPRGDARAACSAVHDRVRRTRVGGLSRSEAWWEVVLGDVPLFIGGGTDRMVLVHEDATGVPDGYAIYSLRADWSTGQAEGRLSVSEVVGVDPAVELALWRALLDHDLVARVEGPLPVDDPLEDVLVDPRQLRVKWDQDLLWVRLLDVAEALERRAYGDASSVVLEVEDPFLPDVGGRFALEVSTDGATCGRTDAPAELRTTIDVLGTCWLGGGSFRRLVRAGRVTELTPGAAERADAMFGTDPAPWCWVRF